MPYYYDVRWIQIMIIACILVYSTLPHGYVIEREIPRESDRQQTLVTYGAENVLSRFPSA